MPAFAFALSARRLREYFTLENRRLQAANETLAQRERAHVLFERGSAHAKAARVLRDAGLNAQAVELFWKSVHELCSAYLARTEAALDLESRERAQVIEQTCESLKSAGQRLPRDFERLLPYLAEDRVENVACLGAAELKVRVDELDALTRLLSPLAEPRALRALQGERRVRVFSAASVFLLCFLGYVGWTRWPVNVALNKPARASSLAFGTTADRAVNGSIWPSPDFHTAEEDNPFLLIDLGSFHDITSAELWTRRDCCPEQSVPLEFQLSVDGVNFKTIARRNEPIDLKRPWLIGSLSEGARYVRVQSMRHTYLVLNEVVVYGRPR